jgi:hypothetical protein
MIHTNSSCFTNNRAKMETLDCPLIDEWINKTWCVHTMEYYSATQKTQSVDVCYNTS